ncbi:MAG TPA: hypothetical protein VFI42_16095, partial [Thermomicrobiaceae bacterium]|nr:hypothetical protein [Thermomicrobiaceae bacterium]
MARTLGVRRAYVRTAPAAVALLLRRLRVELALAATVIGVVLLTSGVFSSFPRLYNRLSDDGLRYAIAHANVFERNIVMYHGARVAPGPSDPFSGVDAAGAQFQQGLAPSIRQVIGHRDFVVDAPEYRFPEPPGPPPALERHVLLRYQSGVADHTAIVQGRAPAVTSQRYTPPGGGAPVPVMEAALSQQTAEALQIKLGDFVELESDPNEPLSRFGNSPPNLAIHVVGYLQVKDPDDDYWFSDVRFDPPSVYDDGNQTQVYATALFAPAAYQDLLNDVSPSLLGYTYRYEVAPASFNAGQLGTLAGDLKQLDAKYPPAFLSRPTDIAVSTQLTNILKRF